MALQVLIFDGFGFPFLPSQVHQLQQVWQLLPDATYALSQFEDLYTWTNSWIEIFLSVGIAMSTRKHALFLWSLTTISSLFAWIALPRICWEGSPRISWCSPLPLPVYFYVHTIWRRMIWYTGCKLSCVSIVQVCHAVTTPIFLLCHLTALAQNMIDTFITLTTYSTFAFLLGFVYLCLDQIGSDCLFLSCHHQSFCLPFQSVIHYPQPLLLVCEIFCLPNELPMEHLCAPVVLPFVLFSFHELKPVPSLTWFSNTKVGSEGYLKKILANNAFQFAEKWHYNESLCLNLLKCPVSPFCLRPLLTFPRPLLVAKTTLN